MARQTSDKFVATQPTRRTPINRGFDRKYHSLIPSNILAQMPGPLGSSSRSVVLSSIRSAIRSFVRQKQPFAVVYRSGNECNLNE